MTGISLGGGSGGSSGSSSSSTTINVDSYGADPTGATSSFAAIQTAIDAGAGNFELVFGKGTYDLNTAVNYAFLPDAVAAAPKGLVLPASATAIKIRGAGKYATTLKLGSSVKSAFLGDQLYASGAARTYQNIEISDLGVNANNVTGFESILFGTYSGGGWGSFGQNCNFSNITVRRCRTYNVVTTAPAGHHSISLGCKASASNGTQKTLEHILVEDCDFAGGNYGVFVGGASSQVTTAATLTGSASASATTVTVSAGNATTIAPYVGEVVAIGDGTLFEVKTISAVNTGTGVITLSTGLQFSKNSGASLTMGRMVNVWHDDITIRNTRHDTLTDTSGGSYSNSANFHIGGFGYGGKCTLENVYGANSGDVGIEVDSMMEAVHNNCTIINANSSNYLPKNFSIPRSKSESDVTTLTTSYAPVSHRQRYIYRSCESKREQAVSQPVSGCSGWNLSYNQSPSPTMGRIDILDCKHITDQTSFRFKGMGILCDGGNVAHVRVKGFEAIADRLNYTCNTASEVPGFIYIYPMANPVRLDISDVRTYVQGTYVVGSGSSTPRYVQLGAYGVSGGTTSPTVWIDVDGLDVDVQAFTFTTGSSAGLSVCDATGVQTPIWNLACRRFRWVRIGGDSNPYGVLLGGTSTGTLKAANFHDCDFLQSTATNRDIANTSSTNRALTQIHPGNAYKGTDTLGAWPSAWISITPGASAYTYQNLDNCREQVTVQGGTVSLVELGRASSFVDTGETAGVFTLEPGDQLRVTYTVVPTMKKLPTK